MADQDRFARALLAVARGLGRIARERARAGDVTPQQQGTLQLIAERGALSTSTLATLLGIDPSTREPQPLEGSSAPGSSPARGLDTTGARPTSVSPRAGGVRPERQRRRDSALRLPAPIASRAEGACAHVIDAMEPA
ncbi:MAG: hypothetical protein KF782_20975 [Labilithrix sp.]|nr:hypothetical protein [Labilithrix sp.]